MKKQIIILLALILCICLMITACSSGLSDEDMEKLFSYIDQKVDGTTGGQPTDGENGGDTQPVSPLDPSNKGEPTVISDDLCIGNTDPNTPYLAVQSYSGDLTIEEGVQITSSGISHLVLVVNGTLTIKKGAAIRVRNGYYPLAPIKLISDLTEEDLSAEPMTDTGILLFEGYYGRGGDGGHGGNGFPGDSEGFLAGGHGGYGGAGGYGGGLFGGNGKRGGGRIPGQTPSASSRHVAVGGGPTGVGSDGMAQGYFAGYGGGSNGGNAGGSGPVGSQNTCGYAGGGGGYGGGVLSIYADKIVVEDTSTPVFVVLGQFGGKCGYPNQAYQDEIDAWPGYSTLRGAEDGKNGDGGLLFISANEYEADSLHWTSAYGTTTVNPLRRGNTEGKITVYEGGHSSMVHTIPGSVFVNGKKLDGSPSQPLAPAWRSEVCPRCNERGWFSGGCTGCLGTGRVILSTEGSDSASGGSSGGNSGGSSSGVECYQCDGTAEVECMGCDGAGEVLWYYADHNPVYGPCSVCQGSGRRPCFYCGCDGVLP